MELSKDKAISWLTTRLGDVLKYEQPTKYIVNSTQYDDSFETPVLTAGQSFLLGYTDEIDNVYEDLPVIIFDDSTTATKFVDFPFKVKSSAMKILKADKKVSDIKFLFYLLQTLNIDSEQHKRYWISKYAELKIPLPNLETQKRIATILDEADTLRQLNQQLIAKYDALTQSLFLDMFGDPVTNPKGWEKVKTIKYCTSIVPGRDKPKSFTGNIPWVTTADLVHLGLTEKSEKSIGLTKSEISEVRAKIIPIGSVIMTCVGDLGVITINKVPIIINQQLHAFQCNDKLNNVFLMYSLSFQKPYMYKMASSTTVPYMNKTVSNNVPTIVPPIHLQTQFAERVQLIEQQNELLFNGLLQKAFNGTL